MSDVVVYSDYICPFCYIGHDRVRRLEKDLGVEVEWRGFEIHPEIPEEGARPGNLGLDEGYMEVARQNMEKLAAEIGLKLEPPTRISNSHMALEASEFAREKGRFKVFHHGVFKAYWQEGRDIGDMAVLQDIAENAGLDPGELEDYLESGKGKEALMDHLRDIRHLGITGVPTFVIGKRMIVGAQPYEVIREAVKAELEKN